MANETEDYLEHFGVKGMKWGKRRAERKEARVAENASIDKARGNQAKRSMELSKLTTKRLAERSDAGKAHLDRKIADKQFEIRYHPDAKQAAKLKSGEKWFKGGKAAAILGLSVVGMGTAAKIVLDAADQAHVDYMNNNKPEDLDG